MSFGNAGRLFLLAAFAVSFFCFGCPEMEDVIEDVFKEPEVAVKEVAVTGVSRDSLDLILDVVIENPNPIGLELARVDYAFELAGRELATGSSGSGLSIKARGKSMTQVPLSIAYKEIEGIYDAARGEDYIDYTLSGKVYLETPAGDVPIPFKSKGKLPVVRPPKVTGVGLKVGKLALTGADLALRFQLFNPNGFPLAVEKFEYALLLEGRDFASGRVEDEKVSPKSSAIIDVPLSIDFMSGLSWAYSLLSRKKASYSLDFKATYIIDKHKVEQKESKKGKIDFNL